MSVLRTSFAVMIRLTSQSSPLGEFAHVLRRLGGPRVATPPRQRPFVAVEPLEPRVALSNFYIARQGNDAAAGTAAAPWRTLQKAADVVRPGDLVTVRAGTYAGFDLRRDGTAAAPITFRAEPGVTINARNAKTPDGINLEGADYILIDGFKVVGLPRFGIRAVTDHNVMIRNNVVDASGKTGIFTGFSDDVLIENNVVSRSVGEHGIYVSNSGDRPVIRGNTIFSNYACGIHMNGDASQGGDGLITGALVEANTLYDNGRAGGSSINADGVQRSRFQNNLIYNAHAAGISLFRENGAAGSSNNVLANNTVVVAADGRWALQVSGGSTGNVVYNNILLNDHSYRGSIAVAADSTPGFKSDFNVVMDRFTRDQGDTRLTLAAWRTTTGQDRNSLIATSSQLFVTRRPATSASRSAARRSTRGRRHKLLRRTRTATLGRTAGESTSVVTSGHDARGVSPDPMRMAVLEGGRRWWLAHLGR